MNGVHDMGGMHCMGLIQSEQDEPVFHERWEARAFALTLAMAAWRKWTRDGSRHQRELIPAAEYLRMSYYEKWFAGLVELLVKSGLVTSAEVESGKPAPSSTKAIPPLTAEKVLPLVARGEPASRDAVMVPHFQVGQRVRARNMHPTGHTRLTRYVRGKVGTIDRDHGIFVFPDTNAHLLGEKPQHVYSVRFAASELWGEQAASRDAVYIDLWDDYLEPA
jgi:nitrile hydratase subunit beta